ncbi:MAG: IS66 family transposase [Deltaproteobacteria bacterium]|nr:IS66 family transposase [Deltaproteobacteria bacterium]
MESASDDVKVLRSLLEKSEKIVARLRDEKESFRKLYELVTLELERLKRQLFGQKAEKVPTTQLDLLFAPVEEALAKTEDGDKEALEKTMSALDKLRKLARLKALENKKSNQKKGGRRKLSEEDLPVARVVIEPPERLVEGGEDLIKIGEEVSTHIEWRPASLVKVEVARPKYKMPEEPKEEEPVDDDAPKTKIVIADVPERPIPKGMAGPGLIAHVIVAKFGDHIPLHRQERIFKRQGLKVARSTLQGWIFGVIQMLSYITQAMWEDTKKNAHWIGVDATGVLVQQVEKCRRGHFWVVIADFGHVLYRFTDVAQSLKLAVKWLPNCWKVFRDAFKRMHRRFSMSFTERSAASLKCAAGHTHVDQSFNWSLKRFRHVKTLP